MIQNTESPVSVVTVPLPLVIKYDEKGKPITEQEVIKNEFPTKKAIEVVTPFEVPWKEWLNGPVAADLNKEASDHAVIIQTMRSIHVNACACDAPVKIWSIGDGNKYVTVTKDIKKGQLELVACTPKSRPLKTSTNIDRVSVWVSDKGVGDAARFTGAKPKAKPGGSETKDESTAVAEREYFIHPEFKLPRDNTDPQAAKDTPGPRTWKSDGDESLYPFWAVERVTRS